MRPVTWLWEELYQVNPWHKSPFSSLTPDISSFLRSSLSWLLIGCSIQPWPLIGWHPPSDVRMSPGDKCTVVSNLVVSNLTRCWQHVPASVSPTDNKHTTYGPRGGGLLWTDKKSNSSCSCYNSEWPTNGGVATGQRPKRLRTWRCAGACLVNLVNLVVPSSLSSYVECRSVHRDV